MRRLNVIAITFALAAQAYAAEVAVVAVDHCDRESSATHARDLRTALTALSPSDRIQTEAATALILGGIPRGSLDEAQRLMVSAHYQAFQADSMPAATRTAGYQKAETTAKASEEMLASLPPSSGRWVLLQDVLVLRALLRWRLGTRAEAESYLSRVLRVDPTHNPQATLPSGFKALMEATRAQVKRLPKLNLAITTHPTSSVFVNGRPFSLIGTGVKLPSDGDYQIEVAFPNRVISRSLHLSESTTMDLSKDFDAFPGAGPCVAVEGDREARLAMLMRAAALMNADVLIATSEEEGRTGAGETYLVATAIHPKTGQEAREGRVRWVGAGSPGDLQKLAAFMVGSAATPPVEVVGGTPAAPPPQSDVPKASVALAEHPVIAEKAKVSEPSSGLRTGSYVAGGVGIVALAGGAVGFILAANTSSQINGLIGANGQFKPNTETQYHQLQGTLGVEQTVGIAGVAVGAAAVAAAVTLFLISRGSSPEANAGSAPTAVTFHF